MSSVAAPPRGGSPVAWVAVSEGADTPRSNRAVGLVSTHHLDRAVDSAEASVAEVEVIVVEVSAVAVIALVVLAVVSDTRATAASVDRLPLTRRPGLAVDAAEVSEVVVSAVTAVVADTTVVQLAAIWSLCALEIAMLTVTAATMTAMTVTEIVIVTAWETETETDSGTGTVNVVVTGMAAAAVMVVVMAAGRSTDASETVRMNLDTTIPARGEGTKPSLIPGSYLSPIKSGFAGGYD